MQDSLKLIQWNARSILLKYNKLLKNCMDANFIIISESWLNSQNSFILKGFDTVRQDRDNQMGGSVLILINRSIKYKRVRVMSRCKGTIEVCDIEFVWKRENYFNRLLPSSSSRANF